MQLFLAYMEDFWCLSCGHTWPGHLTHVNLEFSSSMSTVLNKHSMQLWPKLISPELHHCSSPFSKVVTEQREAELKKLLQDKLYKTLFSQLKSVCHVVRLLMGCLDTWPFRLPFLPDSWWSLKGFPYTPKQNTYTHRKKRETFKKICINCDFYWTWCFPRFSRLRLNGLMFSLGHQISCIKRA